MNIKKKALPIRLPHAEVRSSIVGPLLTWYEGQSTLRCLPWREEVTPYHTWLSEIMLQQTRASAVIPYYTRFLEELPDIESLARCDDELLMKLWQGLGYYSRARNLKKAAGVICAAYGGQLPADFAALLDLPGIGRYTASAIGSIAFGLPLPAVDGNILRVTMRVLQCGEDIAQPAVRRAVEEALAPYYPSGQAAGALNQAFMDLGATVCLPHGAPHCATCPLARLCLAHDAGSEQQLPVKSKNAKRRVEQKTVLLLHQGRALALTKRPDQGLLAGLWELPNLPGHLTQAEVEAWLAARGLRTLTIARLPDARHIFSHVEWQMQGWAVELASPDAMVAEDASPLVWASPEELADAYSVPSAFQYFLHEHRGWTSHA